jgi:non-heme chloroperoxidase
MQGIARLQFVFHESGKRQAKYAIILIHGITAELSHHKKFAQALKVEADVFLPILRGYDQLNKRGDLTYIGHYDNDLFDFIHHIKKMGYKKMILAGHSMGCANILRLLNQNRNIADQFVSFLLFFIHPFLFIKTMQQHSSRRKRMWITLSIKRESCY